MKASERARRRSGEDKKWEDEVLREREIREANERRGNDTNEEGIERRRKIKLEKREKT